MVWGLEKGLRDGNAKSGETERLGESKKAIKMTNWTLRHLNWLVRNYIHLALSQPKHKQINSNKDINCCYSCLFRYVVQVMHCFEEIYLLYTILSKQTYVLNHKLGFDYWKCVYNAKLIIKTQHWNVLFFSPRDLNDFCQKKRSFQYAEN